MTAPHTEKRPTALGTINSVVDIVVKLCVVGGLAFSALEYAAVQERERVARVADFIERFEAGELAASVRVITSELRRLSEREDFQALRALSEAQPDQAEAIRAQVARLLIHDVRGGQGVADELDQVVSFYSSLQTCVAEKLCDSRAAHAFFDGHARSLLDNFEPVFADRASTWPGYGDGLRRFVANAG